LERRYAALATEVQRLGFDLDEKGRGPSWLWLPRIPAGNGRESGRWTTAGGVVGSWRGSITRDQQQRLDASAERANALIARVRQLDPNWRPSERSLIQSPEGAIAHNNAVTREAARRLADVTGIPYGPGPYARESVPASGARPTAAERREVDAIGRVSGCHWCGTFRPGTRSGRYIPDHQWPNALSPPNLAQRLYPHCASCSSRQGGYIRWLLSRE
jgi:hypothetical protein